MNDDDAPQMIWGRATHCPVCHTIEYHGDECGHLHADGRCHNCLALLDRGEFAALKVAGFVIPGRPLWH